LVDNISVEDEPLEVKKRIGYLPENVPLYADLTVDEYLKFIAETRNIPKHQQKNAIEKSLESCALTSYRTRKIETLSKGYRQRTGLAQAILHDPPILILDEPTTGLDPNQIIEIRSLIKELGKTKTVILSTHILQEVEAICSQVLIINDGSIAAQGRPEEIAGTMKGGDTWELVLKYSNEADITAGITKADFIREKLNLLSGISGISAESTDDNLIKTVFFIHGGESAGERIFDWAVDMNIKILQMNRRKISIEDIFVKLTNDETGLQGDQQ